ncbi:MAG: arginyltransferase [Dongiaceae bacterium]|jgi:arginine-tRNA-protein transferase
MSIQNRTRPLAFLVTTELPCPYLADRMERKVVTELSGPHGAEIYETLSRAGFRRSHGIAYRPACRGCSACLPVRVVNAEFDPGRSLRRIERFNADLKSAVRPARGSEEQYRLFTRYLENRHNDGEMVGMSLQEYCAMVETSPLDTRLVEFRKPDDSLVACCLTDWTRDGISAVYSFFDTSEPRRSLGSYMVLWLIREAQRVGLPYVYLGYWVEGSRKMSYKARFRPIELYGPEGWQRA